MSPHLRIADKVAFTSALRMPFRGSQTLSFVHTVRRQLLRPRKVVALPANRHSMTVAAKEFPDGFVICHLLEKNSVFFTK